jgi:hypothetical protein
VEGHWLERREQWEIVADTNRLRSALESMHKAGAGEAVTVPAAVLEDVARIERVQIDRERSDALVASAGATNRGYGVLVARDLSPRKGLLDPQQRVVATWLGKLKMFLQPLEDQGLLRIWDDTDIRPGSEWLEEIKLSLESARVAVLLITQNFLTSEFIGQKELPVLLGKAENRGCLIFWIAVSASTVDDSELSRFQAANDPKQPLDTLTEPEQNRVLKSIYERMKEAIR